MNKKLLSIGCLLFLLGGCGSRYQARALKNVKKKEADFIEKKEGVELRVKRLTPSDFSKTFKGQTLMQDISPLLLTIKNDSDHTVLIDEKSIGLKLLTATQIKSKLSRSIPLRLFGGIVAIPLTIAAIAGTLAAVALLGFSGGCIGCTIIAALAGGIYTGIPLVVGTAGYKTYDALKFNQELGKDLKRKVISEQIIEPHKKQSMLLFAKKAPNNFDISLFNVDQQKKVTFNVQLKDKQ